MITIINILHIFFITKYQIVLNYQNLGKKNNSNIFMHCNLWMKLECVIFLKIKLSSGKIINNFYTKLFCQKHTNHVFFVTVYSFHYLIVHKLAYIFEIWVPKLILQTLRYKHHFFPLKYLLVFQYRFARKKMYNHI